MFRALNAWHAHLPAGDYGGVTISDIDGDGWYEALVANAAGANLVLKHSRGKLRELVSPSLAAPRHGTVGIAAGDLDGDGREELHLVGEPGRLLRCGPDGQWALWSRRSRLASGFRLLDRLDNGRYSIVLMLPSQSVDILEVESGRGPTNLASGPYAGPFHRPPISVPVDANRNGALAWFGGGDANRAHSLTTGTKKKPKEIATPSMALPSELRVAVATDFDNDGNEELLLVNHGEPHRLFRLGAEVEMLDPGDLAEAGFPCEGAAVADLDADGVPELILAGSGSLAVFKSRMAAGNAWLRVRPLTRFLGPARGAVVSCVANGRTRIRTIDQGTNSLSLNEPVAHFGLGRDHQVESVSITWLDGTTLTLPEPDVNCSYNVPYPRG